MHLQSDERVWFRGVRASDASRNLLCTPQQRRLCLSAMADTKANIVITVPAVVLTFSVAQFNDPELRHVMMVVAAFTLLLFGQYAELTKHVSSPGWHLSHHKRRYPRGACLWLLCIVVAAIGVELARMLGGWS
jgi:hypothetical protein